jgi:hypothetical protein
MADSTQKQIDDLQKELDQIDKSIQGIASTMQTSITLSLKGGLDNARKLTEEFEKGSNITKKLKTELDKNKSAIEATFLKQIRLQGLLSIAQRNGNFAREQSLKASINDLNIQRQILTQTDAQLKQLERISEEKKKQNNLGEVAKSQAKKILEPFKEMFTIAGIFKIIIDGALRFQKISVDIGKNLGYGADNANRVTSNLKSIAQSSNDVNVNLANAAEAMNQLNESTGLVAEYSADALKTQIMLTKQFGLTGEEAAGIYQFSVLTGESSSKVNDKMVGAFVATRNSARVGANFKQVMAEAAKVSGQLAANFRNNPAAITAAVVQMKALGTSLEQTKNQGSQLLDFESSLENELKAELLTGQQLNLERARAAALAGDQVELAKELSNQGMTLEKFSSMNVLAQNAYSQALGLNSDQLSEQLKKQKLAQESGKSLAQITEDEVKEAQSRQNIQDKFNAAILKLQDFFGNLVAGPLGSFLDMLTKALDIVTYIGVGLGAVYAVSKAITITQALTTALKTEEAVATGTTNLLLGARTAIMNSQLGILVSQAAAAVIANPLLGLVGLAAAAGVGALVYSQMKDGIIGPGGETIVSGPAGSIQLDKNDSLIAGTNLFGGDGGGISGGNMSIDLTPMVNAITEVRDAVNKLYSKEGIVNIDGKKVGTLLTQGSYKTA